MIYESLQTNSQPADRNNDPDGALPSLSDNHLQELISFFKLLDKWNRELLPKPEEPRHWQVVCASHPISASRSESKLLEATFVLGSAHSSALAFVVVRAQEKGFDGQDECNKHKRENQDRPRPSARLSRLRYCK